MPPAQPANPDEPVTIRRLAFRHRRTLLSGLLLGLVGAAASLAQPLAVGALVEAAGSGRPMVWPVLLMVLLFGADALFTAAQAYLIGRGGENIVLDLRALLVDRVLHADIAAFHKQRQGDLFTRIVTDTSLVKATLSNSLAMLVVNSFMVLGGVVLMVVIDIPLSVVTGLCLGVASGVSLWLARRVRGAAVQNRTDTGEFGADVQRALSALSVVKTSRAEDAEKRRISGLAQRARRSGVRVSALNALMTPAMNVGTQVALAVVIGTGMARVATGSLQIADLTTFVMYLFYLVSPLVMLFMSIGQFQQGRAAIQRVHESVGLRQEEQRALQPAVDERNLRQRDVVSSAETLVRGSAAVEFRDVTFRYGADVAALNSVSFRIPPRGLVAIVGPSGAGKTTIFQLIERLYRVESGSVRVHGEDVTRLPLDVVRGLVGYVEQDNTALYGTVRENLVYANPSASDEDIRHVLELAGLREVVDALPLGLHTTLGDGGASLSGGQLQRLCIARTLLQKPAVLLLDEATSQLDAAAELALRTAMRRISAQCAVVSIAHRISTVVDADQILVLENGQVRATGVHSDLVHRDALYRRFSGVQREGTGRAPDDDAGWRGWFDPAHDSAVRTGERTTG